MPFGILGSWLSRGFCCPVGILLNGLGTTGKKEAQGGELALFGMGSRWVN